jgi:polyphosphate kinase
MVELDQKSRYFHRDLSWLSFNERVLEEADDIQNPFLEQLRFLAIFVSNLDEFNMVRIGELKRVLDAGVQRKDLFGYFPQELYEEIRVRMLTLINRLYQIYNAKRETTFLEHRVVLRKYDELNKEQKKYIKKYFESTLFPIITPLAVDQGRPLPVLPSKTLAFAVQVERDTENFLAMVPVPKNVPRLIKIPSERQEYGFILLDEVIGVHLSYFFRGYKMKEQVLFRIMRDGELTVDEDYAANLLKAVEEEVKKRSRARVVYMEVAAGCGPDFLQILCEGFGFNKEEVVDIHSDFDLTYLFELIAQVNNPEWMYPNFPPARIEYDNIFQRISDGDFIHHVPYQSFYPTVDLIRTAAYDDTVLAIKMTLYRTNADSGIIQALKDAAKKNKQVTVVVEIKARFDEERNINWAKELEEAGCHVIYGIANLKIHSKMTLVVRQEEGRIRRYVHLSTGNYNERTAKIYTDIGYFTCNDDFAKDVSDVFNVITGYSMPSPWQRVISAPHDLRKYFFELIDKEIAHQQKYKNGRIFAKMNSLEDTQMIEKLYEASTAGVKVRLIIRGICCLVPGVPGLSENIKVKSIVGRYLEHSRIYIFNNNANQRIFLSSADWMTRNFDRRVELLFEIYKEEIKEHIQFVMARYWRDTLKSRFLSAQKIYERPSSPQDQVNIHEFLINYYGGQR